MDCYKGTKDRKLKHTAVALGKFDGLHRGHQLLFERLRHCKDLGYQTVIFTFDFHPMSLLGKKKQQLIYTNDERREIAEDFGIDVMIEFPFTMETARMEPEDFIKEILVHDLGAEVIIVGDDFRFGHNRSGDVACLKKFSDMFGYRVENCEKVCDDGKEISATYVRDLIREGRMKDAMRLLGRPYTIRGEISRGKGKGHTVGMPTANITPHEDKLLPPDGVYVTRATTLTTGKTYNALTNIGRNPTVADDNDLSVETFLLGFDGDLYNEPLMISFYDYIRGEKKFPDLSALKQQVEKDVLYAETVFSQLDQI